MTDSEAVARARGKIDPDGRAWLPCDLNGNVIVEVGDDIRALLAERDALLVDKARLDWMEWAYAETHRPTPDDGWLVESFNSSQEGHGDTLRAALDAARGDVE